MADARLKTWEALFTRALALIDSASAQGADVAWSFGGGTVLMRRHRHRFSKDIDIFVPDPQYLGYLTPRLNDLAASMTADYVEESNFLRLAFPEGEIDFIASASLTANPTRSETILGREVRVETTAEIIAKKVWHRGKAFKARDLFDLALVVDQEPEALRELGSILRARKEDLLVRMENADAQLRDGFAQLDVMEYRPSYDHCLAAIKNILALA
jgi:predicted nucleotidyltransferase component of viral defense system